MLTRLQIDNPVFIEWALLRTNWNRKLHKHIIIQEGRNASWYKFVAAHVAQLRGSPRSGVVFAGWTAAVYDYCFTGVASQSYIATADAVKTMAFEGKATIFRSAFSAWWGGKKAQQSIKENAYKARMKTVEAAIEHSSVNRKTQLAIEMRNFRAQQSPDSSNPKRTHQKAARPYNGHAMLFSITSSWTIYVCCSTFMRYRSSMASCFCTLGKKSDRLHGLIWGDGRARTGRGSSSKYTHPQPPWRQPCRNRAWNFVRINRGKPYSEKEFDIKARETREEEEEEWCCVSLCLLHCVESDSVQTTSHTQDVLSWVYKRRVRECLRRRRALLVGHVFRDGLVASEVNDGSL